MTRMEKRAAVLKEYGDASIPSICQTVHESITGACDCQIDLDNMYKFLRTCLETWEESLNSTRYDNAVKELVSSTLDEIYKSMWTARYARKD